MDLLDPNVGRERPGNNEPPPIMAQDGAVALRLMQARSLLDTFRRVFAVDDELKVATELYHGAGYDAPRVEVAATLTTKGGFVIYRFRDRRAGQDFGGTRRRTTLDFDFPLRELTPGSYVLTVRARSMDAQPIDVSRELRFDVR